MRGKPRFPHQVIMEKAGQAPAPGGKPPPRIGSAFMLPSKENPMATCYARVDCGVYIIPRERDKSRDINF